MNQKHLLLISAAAAWMALNVVYAQSPAMIIPANTDVLIRASETIDSRTADEGRIYAGTRSSGSRRSANLHSWQGG